jgi:hypothetical protein
MVLKRCTALQRQCVDSCVPLLIVELGFNLSFMGPFIACRLVRIGMEAAEAKCTPRESEARGLCDCHGVLTCIVF